VADYRTNQVTIRAGSQERITLTLKADNVAVNLTGYTEGKVYLKKLDGNAVRIISTNDASPILSFDSDRTTGKLHIDPETDTFTNDDEYLVGYVDVQAASGKWYAFEEDEEFGLIVRPYFTSTTSSSTTSSSTSTTSTTTT